MRRRVYIPSRAVNASVSLLKQNKWNPGSPTPHFSTVGKGNEKSEKDGDEVLRKVLLLRRCSEAPLNNTNRASTLAHSGYFMRVYSFKTDHFKSSNHKSSARTVYTGGPIRTIQCGRAADFI